MYFKNLSQLIFVIFMISLLLTALFSLFIIVLIKKGVFKKLKLELGIFTGGGMLCTIFATIVLIACCIYSSTYTPIFIIVFLIWELYVNAYYSAELKRKKEILELKTKMENEPYGSSLYYTYKKQYDSLKTREKLIDVGKIVSEFAMFAATYNAVSEYNKKEMEKTRDLLDRTRSAVEKLEDRSLANNGLSNNENEQ